MPPTAALALSRELSSAGTCSLGKKFNCTPQRSELQRRLDVVRSILDATHDHAPSAVQDIAREARGMAIVLVYAAYENMLYSLCRALLEHVISLRVSNRRLVPGLQVFALHPKLKGLTDSSASKIWNSSGIDIVNILSSSSCTISTDIFPDDGSHMRRAQVATFCRLFNLGDPAPVLREAWQRIDTVVSERNAVAHGRMTPEEVGRNYSIGDMRSFLSTWETRWNEFLDWAESRAASRDTFRVRR
ncbi:HEPN domain-containing protein [Streptomyces sp. NPDC058420]|uniref:HEPN domain-containing protein n=1 Tax=Streptomyces sp. NPDC058420 TaxID=3346489 RepID=UPI00364E38C8